MVIPPTLNAENFPLLKTLNLSENQLQVIPKEIGFLTSLQTLDVSDNELKCLPREFGNLVNLTELDIQSNRLTVLIPEIQFMINLEEIDLSDNELIEIPAQFGLLEKVRYINLEGNINIKCPPQRVIALGEAAILSYLRQINNSGSIQYIRTKLIALGNGGAGKTLLLKCIREGPQEKPVTVVTEGVSISVYEVNTKSPMVTYTFYDFAGQDVYHSTHPFFFSKKAIYLLCCNLRRGFNRIEYWLNSIKIRAPDANVLVVGTFADLVDDQDFPKKFFGSNASTSTGGSAGTILGINEVRNPHLYATSK